MTTYSPGCNIPRVGVDWSGIFTNFCSSSHNFGYKYPRKSIKSSEDSDDSLDLKKHEPKNGSLGWRPGPGKVSLKNAEYPQL